MPVTSKKATPALIAQTSALQQKKNKLASQQAQRTVPAVSPVAPPMQPGMQPGMDLRSQMQAANQQFQSSPEMQGLQAAQTALQNLPQAQAISQLGQSIQMQNRQPTAQEMAQLQQLNAELQNSPQYKSMMTAQQTAMGSPAAMNLQKMNEQYAQQMQPQYNLAMGSLGMGTQAPQNALQPYNPNMAQLPQSGLQPYNPNQGQDKFAQSQAYLAQQNNLQAALPQSGLQPYNPIQAQVGAPGTGLGTNMQSMQPGMQAPQQSAFQGNQQTPAVQSSQPNPMNSGIGTLMKQPSPTQSGGGGGVM